MNNFKGFYTESESLPSHTGILIVNMPNKPKSDWMTTSKLYTDLSDHFQTVKKMKENVFVCYRKISNVSTCGNITYTPEEIETMEKTARSWSTTSVYTVALTFIKPDDVVLDFGAGRFQNIKQSIVNIGATYVPYDTGIDGINNLSIIRGLYDVVMASNVLNVQSKIVDQEKAHKAYLSTICQLVAAVK